MVDYWESLTAQPDYTKDWVKEYLNPPSKTHFFQEFVDVAGGVVEVEFVLAGFDRSQILVKISSEKKKITVTNKQTGLELVSREIENKKNIDLSKNVTSVLKDGLLKISIPILQKEKELEVEVN